MAGNTLMTCPAAALACAGAQAGGNVNNNAFTMERVDIDGDATTFTSSSAELALPAGATILFAGLYYGARTSAGTGGAAAPAAATRSAVKLRVCDRLPDALVLVGAPGARVRGGVPCWRIPRLQAGGRRTFTVTTRATDSATNTARAQGANARPTRARTSVRVLGGPTACPAALAAC